MPGDIFGEMAFVSGERRTADVVAGNDVEILKIDTSVLDRIRRRYPQVGGKLFRNISAILSAKLVKANQALSARPS
jgi:CRP-like cAMP-binding protein